MTPEPTSIVAFRNGSIGNTLAAVPALRALRKAYPNAVLSVVVDTTGFALLENCPWIDRLLIYDKRGKDRSFRAQVALVRELRKLKPSHAVLFKRFFRNGALALLSGAKVRIGFETGGKRPFLTHAVPYEERVHVVDLDLRLVSLLGVHTSDRHVELFLSGEDRQKAWELAGTGPFLVAHYGGQTTPPDFVAVDRFRSMLQSIAADGMKVVLIGTGTLETENARFLASRMENCESAVNLPLRVTAAIIERASLFVGFNSGPAHMAAASGTPEIVIFRPDQKVEDEIMKWGPVSDRSRAVVPPPSATDDEWARFQTRVLDMARELQHGLEAPILQKR